MAINALDLTTVEVVKQYLNVVDSDDDVLLQRLVTAQSQWFINAINRAIKSTTYTEKFNGDDARIRSADSQPPFRALQWGVGGYGFAMMLKEMPVISITSVTIDGVVIPIATNLGMATQTDGWVLHDGGRLELVGYRFTYGVRNCQVIYVAGYAAVPFDVEQAVVELVSWRYREKDRIGQLSKSGGGETVQFSPYAAPQSVQAVIDTYRRYQV